MPECAWKSHTLLENKLNVAGKPIYIQSELVHDTKRKSEKHELIRVVCIMN